MPWDSTGFGGRIGAVRKFKHVHDKACQCHSCQSRGICSAESCLPWFASMEGHTDMKQEGDYSAFSTGTHYDVMPSIKTEERFDDLALGGAEEWRLSGEHEDHWRAFQDLSSHDHHSYRFESEGDLGDIDVSYWQNLGSRNPGSSRPDTGCSLFASQTSSLQSPSMLASPTSSLTGIRPSSPGPSSFYERPLAHAPEPSRSSYAPEAPQILYDVFADDSTAAEAYESFEKTTSSLRDALPSPPLTTMTASGMILPLGESSLRAELDWSDYGSVASSPRDAPLLSPALNAHVKAEPEEFPFDTPVKLELDEFPFDTQSESLSAPGRRAKRQKSKNSLISPKVSDERISAEDSRTSIACHSCRKRKSKCDGGRPCEACVRMNLDCTYDAFRRRRGRGRKTLAQEAAMAEQYYDDRPSLAPYRSYSYNASAEESQAGVPLNEPLAEALELPSIDARGSLVRRHTTQ